MGTASTAPADRSTASGYTRTVGWKQRISVFVLVVFAAVPVSRAFCVLTCGSSAESSAHHGRGSQQCDEPAPSPAGVHIEGVSEHDCSAHGGTVSQVATTAERISVHVAPAVSAAPTRDTTFDSVPANAPAVEYTRPPGLAPPTIPLVLRV